MVNYSLEYVTTGKREKLSGMAFPMRLEGTGGFLTANEGLGSIRDGIKQLLLTGVGERVMRPTFGTGLRYAAFEMLDDIELEALKRQIVEAIETYEPRIVVKKFTVTPQQEQQKLFLSMVIAPKDNFLTEERVELLV
jgi:hypothetical protein